MTLLSELENLKSKNMKMGGMEGVKKQKSLGKLTVRERIEKLADPGSFLEFGILADHTPHNPDLKGKDTPADGVVTGWIKVHGKPVALIAYDFTVVAGTIGEVGERKVERIRKSALENLTPIVWLLDSAGARVQEIAGAQFAGTGGLFFEQIQMSGVIPQVAAIMGPTAAGTSYIGALADYTPMVKGIGSMALAGAPLVKAAIGEEVSTEDLGGSKIHSQISGCADGEFDSDDECISAIRDYLSYFPSNCSEKPPKKVFSGNLKISDEILEILPESSRQAYDMKEIVRLVLDDQVFFEIKPDFAKNIITGFGRVNGHSVGILANQPSFMGGAIDINASDKATRFLMSCEAFGIPVVFLHDCPGFMVGSQMEKMGIIRHGAKFLHTVGTLTVPKLSVVIRKSYGAGYYVMCGKGLKPDLLVGWPQAEISLMGPQGAVNIVMKNKDDASAKEAMLKEYQASIGGLQSAQQAHIDDLIDPRDTRKVLAQSLEICQNKRRLKRSNFSPVLPV